MRLLTRAVLSLTVLCYLGAFVRPASTASSNQATQITRSLNSQAGVSSISGDGRVVAFQTSADLLGSNPDHTAEVYLVNSDGTGLRQITSSDQISNDGQLSADGGTLVLRSSGDLVPGQNRDHNFEMFVVDLATLTFRQLTRSNNGAVPDRHSVTGDGSVIAFSGTGNYTGRNPHGEDQIFVINSDGTGLRQLTDGRSKADLSFQPLISRDGSRIVFASTGDLVGANPDHSIDLFSIRPDGSDLRQLTFFAPYDNETNNPPTYSISGDGSLVAFDADYDPLGTNPGSIFQVFTVKTDGTGLAQVTHAMNDTYAPSLRSDGSEIVFLSIDALTGPNPLGLEHLYRANADGTGVVQLTNFTPATAGGAGTAPFFSADGSRIAYSTSSDPFGANPDRTQEAFALKRDGTGLVQLSQTALYAHQRPTISGAGNRVAFDTQSDLACPTCSNADHSREIFIANSDGTGLRQLTSSTLGASTAPSLSRDGSVVVFQSTSDLVGTNPLHRPTIFAVNADGTNMRQITFTGRQSRDAVVSRDGRFIAFSSNANYVGQNPDFGFEIYVVAIDGVCKDGGPSTGCAQVTNTAPNPASFTTRFPSISGDGSRLVFQSAVNLTGGNPDNNVELFSVNANGTGLTQITSTVSLGRAIGIQRPALSADAMTVAFSTDSDPLGTNPDHSREIFVVGFDGTGLRQLTFGAPLFDSFTPSITADGRQIAFQSFLNTRGRNREETVQIFLINSDGSALRQVTTGLTVSTLPTINDDGGRMTFISNEDFTGANADHSPEIFVLSLKAAGK